MTCSMWGRRRRVAPAQVSWALDRAGPQLLGAWRGLLVCPWAPVRMRCGKVHLRAHLQAKTIRSLATQGGRVSASAKAVA